MCSKPKGTSRRPSLKTCYGFFRHLKAVCKQSSTPIRKCVSYFRATGTTRCCLSLIWCNPAIRTPYERRKGKEETWTRVKKRHSRAWRRPIPLVVVVRAWALGFGFPLMIQTCFVGVTSEDLLVESVLSHCSGTSRSHVFLIFPVTNYKKESISL